MSLRDAYPAANLSVGMAWASDEAPAINSILPVQVIGFGAEDWTSPLTVSEVRWESVTRWRFARGMETPYPHPEDGAPWNCPVPPSTAPDRLVQFHGAPASDRSTTPTTAPLDVQVGGGHYKSFKIQPVEYIDANGLDYLQGNVVKYVSRHKSKNGAEDVRKAIHYLELILQLQYGEGKNV